MNLNPQNALRLKENTVVLNENDISTEDLASDSQSVISVDQMEDVNVQANGQNFQHN